jgi:hypothetical protein
MTRKDKWEKEKCEKETEREQERETWKEREREIERYLSTCLFVHWTLILPQNHIRKQNPKWAETIFEKWWSLWLTCQQKISDNTDSTDLLFS